MLLTPEELYAFYQEVIALLTPISLPSMPVDPVRARAKLKLLKEHVEGLIEADLAGAPNEVRWALLDGELVGRLEAAIVRLEEIGLQSN